MTQKHATNTDSWIPKITPTRVFVFFKQKSISRKKNLHHLRTTTFPQIVFGNKFEHIMCKVTLTCRTQFLRFTIAKVNFFIYKIQSVEKIQTKQDLHDISINSFRSSNNTATPMLSFVITLFSMASEPSEFAIAS